MKNKIKKEGVKERGITTKEILEIVMGNLSDKEKEQSIVLSCLNISSIILLSYMVYHYAELIQ